MTAEVRREKYTLPKVDPPSLEGLSAQVPAPTPPTAKELVERLHSRLVESAQRRERQPGEPVREGDLVECDLVTLVDGQVVPGGVKQAVRWEVRDFLHLPGLFEELVGMKTFSARTFQLRLPDDYPVQPVAGKTATVYLELGRAFEVVHPPDMEDAATLQRAGLGKDLEQALETIAAEIDAEQGQELLMEATEAVLEQLSLRVTEEIPAAAVDEELRRTWLETEGRVLQGRDFSQDLVDEAQRRFLENPSLRGEVEHRIRVGLALGALIEKEGIAPSTETMETLLEAAAEQVGVDSEDARRSLAADPALALRASQEALRLAAVEYVMARASVEVVEAS